MSRFGDSPLPKVKSVWLWPARWQRSSSWCWDWARKPKLRSIDSLGSCLLRTCWLSCWGNKKKKIWKPKGNAFLSQRLPLPSADKPCDLVIWAKEMYLGSRSNVTKQGREG